MILLHLVLANNWSRVLTRDSISFVFISQTFSQCEQQSSLWSSSGNEHRDKFWWSHSRKRSAIGLHICANCIKCPKIYIESIKPFHVWFYNQRVPFWLSIKSWDFPHFNFTTLSLNSKFGDRREFWVLTLTIFSVSMPSLIPAYFSQIPCELLRDRQRQPGCHKIPFNERGDLLPGMRRMQYQL